MRSLRKSQSDRVLTGVCGGIGRFFGISSNLVRVIFVITGAVLIYILLALFLEEGM
ncbi:PspC domain-containing protein [Vagococcus sp. PNs007]|uniref:PspC domain-containing protein n=1 Tax=Vagococcus proximus TaxID=2991417 RepID=A0ABT5X2V9_9ENTE|nr:PspC domain-containing protein [Vagococcus proximus]MDF0480336.1 PspC domain-containing protein [Vagococcus proximus]